MVADSGGRHLVDGDAGADVGAVGFAGLGAGEKRGEGAGMVAAAVAVRASFVGGESSEHIEVAAKVAQRFQNWRQGEIGAFGGGRPVRHVFAVRHVEEREPVGSFASGAVVIRPGGDRAHDFEPREGDRGSEAAENRAAGKRNRMAHWGHSFPRRRRNGSLAAISAARVENL